jgi:hypothetical protein
MTLRKMLHPEKKRQRLGGRQCNNDEVVADDIDFQASIESLSGDVLANIFGFLLPRDIMNARVNNKMRDAAKITIVPPTYELVVDSVKRYNAMNVMATALPNLPKIILGDLESAIKYVDGEDPDEELAARTANATAHDIGIISNFTNLRELQIASSLFGGQLNGRYPCFFNFPLVQMFSVDGRFGSNHLKFDLEMLAGLPSLKVFDCGLQKYLTGNLSSLRVLKNTLEYVCIESSGPIKGNFMDLADFPHLEVLDLRDTAVTGDIRDIGEEDFPSLKLLALPKGVNGGSEREFQRISDAQDVVRIPYLFQKQRPEIVLKDWYAKLSSNDVPDIYEINESLYDIAIDQYAPIFISLVRAGNRLGYQWTTSSEDSSCEVNWLDPEPDRESSDYRTYMEELQKIEGQVTTFKGFHQPPTQEEFERIVERLHDDEWNDGVELESEFDSDSDSDSESDSGDDEMEDN